MENVKLLPPDRPLAYSLAVYGISSLRGNDVPSLETKSRGHGAYDRLFIFAVQFPQFWQSGWLVVTFYFA
jgi:hypothetical protein